MARLQLEPSFGYKIHTINKPASIALTFLSVLSISYLLKRRTGPEEPERFKQGDGAQSQYSTPAGPKIVCSHGLLTQMLARQRKALVLLNLSTVREELE